MLGWHTHAPGQLTTGERHHAAAPLTIKNHLRLQGLQGSWASLTGSPAPSRHSRKDSCTSLLFELEIDDDGDSKTASKGLPDGLNPHCMPLREEERRLWRMATQAREAALEEGGYVNVHLFGQHLAASTRMLTWMRTGLGNGSKELSLSARHTFLVTKLEGLGYYIVDPNYKQQLRVSGATPEYDELLTELPDVLVASGEQLAEWLRCVHAEMSKCFSDRGTPLPPWREYAALCGIWLVTKAEDVLVDPYISSSTTATAPYTTAGNGATAAAAVAAVAGRAPAAAPAGTSSDSTTTQFGARVTTPRSSGGIARALHLQYDYI